MREAWREGDGTAPVGSWDYERRVWPVVQLSRLIRDGVRYLQNAIPLVVGGFESLLKIGRQYLKAQFPQRVPAIAAGVGIDLSIVDGEDVYDDRSALVHGFGLDLELPHEIDESGRRFSALQDDVTSRGPPNYRGSLLAATFEDEARIKERWPARVTMREAVEKII